MNTKELNEMRRTITSLIDDVKYHSDSLSDLERLPVIQLKIILAKINKLTEKTTILLHYVEKQGKLSDMVFEDQVKDSPESETSHEKEEMFEKDSKLSTEKEGNGLPSSSQNVEDKLKKLIVADLSGAIDINEKYLFASVLFNGNIKNFTNVVEEVDKISDKNSGKTYLQNLKKKYNWDMEDDTVKNFIDLIERKFDQL